MISNNELHPLLRRAVLFLEEKDWGSADDYCERLLDLEPECAYAYVIKLMARLKIDREEDIGKAQNSFREWHSYKNALRFADPILRERLEGYLDKVEETIKNQELQRLADEEEKKRIAEEARLSEIYQKALLSQENNSLQSIKTAISLYTEIIDYRDSRQKIVECEELLKKAEEKQLIQEAETKKEKEKSKIISILIVVIVLLLIVVVISFSVESNNKKARVIEQNLAGMVFNGTDTDYVNSTGGGAITMAVEITEYENTYSFYDDGTFSVNTIKRYDKEPFVTYNDKRVWDNVSEYSNTGTWSNVTVSFFSDISVMVDGKRCVLNIDSQNIPTSITIDNVKYYCD